MLGASELIFLGNVKEVGREHGKHNGRQNLREQQARFGWIPVRLTAYGSLDQLLKYLD